MEERLQKIIANAGICSRRAAERLLEDGRVTVNGRVASFGEKADPEQDTIAVDGRVIARQETYTYIMLNKPRGYACTLSDPHAEHLVTELVSDCGVRVYPVGRLDVDSEGLLLLTNDGDFTNEMIHPRHRVDKIYHVTVTGGRENRIEDLRAIRTLDGESIAPAQVRLMQRRGGEATLEIIIHEGKKRQIRRMCKAVGMTVLRLRRVAENTLCLGDLPEGKWRYLTAEEVASCRKGMPD